MIVVKLMGGLGNQLFQYATGFCLAQKLSTPLKLDLSWFANIRSGVTKREYLLDAFCISAAPATTEEVERLRGKGTYLLIRLLSGLLRCRYMKEARYSFDPAVLLLTSPAYLDGYWQSEKYFSDCREELLQEFVLKGSLDQVVSFVEESEVSGAVAIHVRRGDYLTSPSAASMHGTCPIDYYVRAVKHLKEKLSEPRFIIFSDDPNWVQESLVPAIGPATVVDNHGPTSASRDIILMSRCSHFIISNSTFSWWGAWLCENPDKIVIAPKKWFNDPCINTNDLIPESWLRI